MHFKIHLIKNQKTLQMYDSLFLAQMHYLFWHWKRLQLLKEVELTNEMESGVLPLTNIIPYRLGGCLLSLWSGFCSL